MKLPDDIFAKIREDFSGGETVAIIDRLEGLTQADSALFTVRILRCILFLARGRTAELEDAISLAMRDTRDLIVSAEYDGHFGAIQRDLTLPFNLKTLTQIKDRVDELAFKIGAANHSSLPTYGRSEDGARPHIEVNAQGYHFVVVERGQELKRITTLDWNDLLYRIFEGVTFSVAFDYELAHRVENRDCRRLGFQRQVELLSQLSEEWGLREAQEHARILEKHPFDDFSSVRARLTGELREGGRSPQDAWSMACERYPLP